VRKEAVLKATGRGLAVAPERIEISPAGTAPALVAWTADHPPADVAIADLDLGPGCHAAVAVLAPGPLEVMIHRAAGVTFAPVAAG
jgi:4'-phosphopantetheinyl transferase